jgi:hypothetical protein
MSFSRSRTKLINDYYLFDNRIEDIITIRDLGVVFTTNLTFQPHIDHICVKFLRTLGFLIRNTKELRNEQCLKMFYTSLDTYVGILFHYLESLTSRTDRIA